MPLPVAHSLAGYIFYEIKPFLFFKNGWKNFLFIMILANLPDIDFLPGLIIGNPNQFHHGISHSLGMAVFSGLILGWFFSRKNGNFWKYFIFTTLIYYSHVFLDFLTEDYRKPFGVLLFWPFNSIYYTSSIPLFLKTIRSNTSSTFFQSLFHPENFHAIIRECMVMGSVIVFYKLMKKFTKS